MHISRKEFFHRALGAVGAGALTWSASDGLSPKALGDPKEPSDGYLHLSVDPAPRLPPSLLGDPKTPVGAKIRGANHVLKFEDSDAVDLNDAWAALWRVWDWSGWIQPQLDDIARIGNAVRFWGNTLVLALGNLSLGQYIAQWTQALDYMDRMGVLVYPCGGDLAHWGNYSIDESVKCYTELSGLLASYSNVIGMDIVNEANLFPGYLVRPTNRLYQQPLSYTDFVRDLGLAVQTQGIPISYSRSLSAAEEWTMESPLDAAGDFLDFHVYYTPSPSDSLAVYETPWGSGKKMLIGEFGMNLNQSPESRRGNYEAVRDLTVRDPNCVGAFAWSAYDPSTTPDWECGLYDRHRVLRTDIAEPFSTFPLF
jgi:hypothetical protein